MQNFSVNSLKPDVKYDVISFLPIGSRRHFHVKSQNKSLRSYITKYLRILTEEGITSIEENLVGLKKKKDENMKSISAAIRDCKTLRKLKLVMENNTLNDQDIKAFCEALGSLSHLSELVLDLKKNQFSKDGLKLISETLVGISQLETLAIDLSNNNFDAVTDFTNNLSKLSNLKRFKLAIHNKKLKSNYIKPLSDAIFNLKVLESLNLDFTGNHECKLGSLKNAFQKLTLLSTLELNLSDTISGDKNFETVLETICCAKQLSSLNLNMRKSNISGKGFACLSKIKDKPLYIQNVKLDLEENVVDNPGLESLMFGLAGFTKVSKLDLNLGKNLFTEVGHLSLAITSLKELYYLNINLSKNQVSESLKSIYLSDLIKLQHVIINTSYTAAKDEEANFLFNHLKTKKSKFVLSFAGCSISKDCKDRIQEEICTYSHGSVYFESE